MFHELLPVSRLLPEKQPNVRLKSTAPLFASAEGFEEYREEMHQIFRAENIPSVLLMYVISNVPKRTAAMTDPDIGQLHSEVLTSKKCCSVFGFYINIFTPRVTYRP